MMISLSNSFFFPLNCFLYFFFLTSPSLWMMLLAWERDSGSVWLWLLMDNLRFQIETFAYIFQFYSRMNRCVKRPSLSLESSQENKRVTWFSYFDGCPSNKQRHIFVTKERLRLWLITEVEGETSHTEMSSGTDHLPSSSPLFFFVFTVFFQFIIFLLCLIRSHDFLTMRFHSLQSSSVSLMMEKMTLSQERRDKRGEAWVSLDEGWSSLSSSWNKTLFLLFMTFRGLTSSFWGH